MGSEFVNIKSVSLTCSAKMGSWRDSCLDLQFSSGVLKNQIPAITRITRTVIKV